MSQPKTTIDLPFSPEDVRMGHHLGNAIAGYRDGDFKRSAEGMVDAVRAFQAAADELDRLRAENKRLREALKPLADAADIVTYGEDHWAIGAGIYYSHARAARAAIKSPPGKEE